MSTSSFCKGHRDRLNPGNSRLHTIYKIYTKFTHTWNRIIHAVLKNLLTYLHVAIWCLSFVTEQKRKLRQVIKFDRFLDDIHSTVRPFDHTFCVFVDNKFSVQKSFHTEILLRYASQLRRNMIHSISHQKINIA